MFWGGFALLGRRQEPSTDFRQEAMPSAFQHSCSYSRGLGGKGAGEDGMLWEREL